MDTFRVPWTCLREMPRKAKAPKWYPVRPIKPKDHFISSDFADSQPFVPSYDKEKVNMFLLMAHDYAKLWKLETKVEETKRFEFAGEENERLCRRYVLRALQNKRKIAETKPRFIMKRFQNIPSKVRQFMYPGEPSQTKQQLGQEQSQSESKLQNGPVKRSPSRLSTARDSRDLLLEKQKNSTRCDPAEVTISPEAVQCESEMDMVSPSPEITNLLDCKSSHKSSRLSEAPQAPNHFHVAFDGSEVHVREMPPGHRHPLKINAPPH